MLYLYHQSGSEIALHFPKNTPSISTSIAAKFAPNPLSQTVTIRHIPAIFAGISALKKQQMYYSITLKKVPIQNNFSQDRPSKKPQLFVADCKIIVRELLIIARFAAFAMIVKPSHNFLLFCCRVAIDKQKLLTEY